MEIIRQDILDSVEKIPAFPKSVHMIQKLTSDVDCNPDELVRVVEHDPVLISKILKLVNSSYFGLARKITSINHAIVYIGLNTLKNTALSIATIGSMPLRNEAHFNMDAFLKHSLATAAISRMLAKKSYSVPERETFDYFLSGLLHDFGKIILARYLPKEYKETLLKAKSGEVPLHEAEKEAFGVNHATIGALLVEKWQLPANLRECLKNHHILTNECPHMGCLVIIADQIAKKLQIGDSGNHSNEPVPLNASNQFGGDIEQIIVSLGDISHEVEKAMVFGKL